MDVHLYLMCYQGEALVASNLEAEAFGAYMAVGTKKHTARNLLFFELDPSVRSEYLAIEKGIEQCKPNEDGTPKRSKYISIYRALEHLPLEAFRKLHMVTRDGRVLTIDEAPYEDSMDTSSVHLYTELSPVTPRVISKQNPREFTQLITDPANPVSVPRVVFADMLIERDDDGALAGYLPYANPAHIIDCIEELETRTATKKTKTVDRNPRLIAFYRTIGRGIFLGDQTGLKFYPFPSREELEDKYHLWWRSASID